MITFSIFPTAVAKFQLGREYTAEETTFVDSQETRPNINNTTSKDNYVLRHWAMANLKSFIETSLNEYMHKVYAPKNQVTLRVTQSWLNYCKPGEAHHKHVHPNSFVSGVLYMKASEERDRIYFYRGGYNQISLTTESWNLHNSESWYFEVGAGDLMVFPSSLTHMVMPVKEDRVSLSFNTFPEGDLSDEITLTALNLTGVS